MAATRLADKLARITSDPSGAKDFIICDAKDSDMGFGGTHTGPVYGADGKPTGRFKTRAAFFDQIRAIVQQDIVDLMLLSASSLVRLAGDEKLFAGSKMAKAVRANDATDIWDLRHATYRATPSIPFRTAEIAHVYSANPDLRLADIGLYAVTYNNDIEADWRSLTAFNEFRREAEAAQFPYFLEVFNPNAASNLDPEKMPFYVNDCIIRTLAGVPERVRPRFLKVVYNGPRATEELAGYDPSLIVGVLGGSSGTTRDCLQLLHDAKKYGARVALFGRKINLSEDPLGIIEQMRHVADGDVSPEEGVKAYHAGLAKKKLKPLRALNEDLAVTDPVLKS
jgi:hypothetical protein